MLIIASKMTIFIFVALVVVATLVASTFIARMKNGNRKKVNNRPNYKDKGGNESKD